jgi:GH18 family chitinase
MLSRRCPLYRFACSLNTSSPGSEKRAEVKHPIPPYAPTGKHHRNQAVCARKNDFTFAADSDSADNTHHAKFAALKQTSLNLNILVSIGGGGGSNPLFFLAGDVGKRAVFVASVEDEIWYWQSSQR